MIPWGNAIMIIVDLYMIDFIWVASCSWSNYTLLLLLFVVEKVLLLLVIFLTGKNGHLNDSPFLSNHSFSGRLNLQWKYWLDNGLRAVTWWININSSVFFHALSVEISLCSIYIYCRFHAIVHVLYITQSGFQLIFPSNNLYICWSNVSSLRGIAFRYIYSLSQLRPWASYQIRKIVGCACVGNAWNFFPHHRLQWNRLLAIPACITARASRTCRDACRDC